MAKKRRHQQDAKPVPDHERHSDSGDPNPRGRKFNETIAFVLGFAGLAFSAYAFTHNFWVRLILAGLGLLCLLRLARENVP